jgi:hypothetical protein
MERKRALLKAACLPPGTVTIALDSLLFFFIACLDDSAVTIHCKTANLQNQSYRVHPANLQTSIQNENNIYDNGFCKSLDFFLYFSIYDHFAQTYLLNPPLQLHLSEIINLTI